MYSIFGFAFSSFDGSFLKNASTTDQKSFRIWDNGFELSEGRSLISEGQKKWDDFKK
ncbi:MAG: hypothetical protein IPL26_10215 [Leptospiraceae bacterium]|nr:hypothetical protein [Leptospiraceae bacterium]